MGWGKCQYPHQEHMPFAKEPLKSLYVTQRLVTTLALVPWWALYYALAPRSRRPRASWSLKQIISVKFTRRVYKVTELAGVTWYTRDPDAECDPRELRETRFEWAQALPPELRTGVLVDEHVPFKRVGMFVWPKVPPPVKPYHDTDVNRLGKLPDCDSDEHIHEHDSEEGKVPVVGIFLHGGGYCHMSAHETCGTSKIPRRLIRDQAFDEIYAVEYRLLQHGPFPAAVQDAATVYAEVLRRYSDHTSPCNDSTDSITTVDKDEEHDTHPVIGYHNHSDGVHEKPRAESTGYFPTHKNCKIILIGDSAGGNLVLALARWIRDENVLPPPDGLLLLSPSCDPAHAFPESPSSYVPRPHESTDYLVDTPEPRALLQRTFLGHNPLETMHSPYVSPASAKVMRAFYGELFTANVEELTIDGLDAAAIQRIRTFDTAPSTPIAGSTPKPGPPTPATPGPLHPASLARPVLAAPRGLSLFSAFPATCVVLGDAERLEREVVKLVGAMERDAVPVHTVWVKDAPHDVLMVGWWDERVRDGVWRDVEAWVGTVART